MAQPHEYTGEGGDKSNYVESWNPNPFPSSTATLVPGKKVDVALANIGKFTQSNGTVRQTIKQSITANPPQHTEYGRTAAN